MDYLRKLLDIQKAMMLDGMTFEVATAKTPLLAILNLQIAQMYVMELLQMESSDSGDAATALDHIQKAIEFLHTDASAYEH